MGETSRSMGVFYAADKLSK